MPTMESLKVSKVHYTVVIFHIWTISAILMHACIIIRRGQLSQLSRGRYITYIEQV